MRQKGKNNNITKKEEKLYNLIYLCKLYSCAGKQDELTEEL